MLVTREIDNGGWGGADVCQECDVVNSTNQRIWKNKTKIISAFEQNGSRIKRFRKPERSDVDESLFNLLKPTSHVMHLQFNILQLYALPTLYLCVLYLSENKQRLVPLTA